MTCRIGRALDIGVVAERVEAAAQRDWLLGVGCRLQQGWLWSRPAPGSTAAPAASAAA